MNRENIIVGLIVLLSIFSCKKDEQKIDNGGIEVPTGKLWIHLHTYVGLNDIEAYGEEVDDESGRKIQLDLGQYYLTDFELVKLNGDTYLIDTTIILKTIDQDSYSLGNIPVGNYKQVRFKIGLNSYYEQMQPIFLKTGELADSSMWFNKGAFDGDYIYFNAKGQIDTSKDFSGKMASFNYSIGTQPNVFSIQLPENNFAIYDGLISYIHLKGDFSNLFNGIMLSQESNLNIITTTDNQSKIDLISVLKQNIETDFFDFE